jgi:predicted peptidase
MAQEAYVFEHSVSRALRLGYWLHLPRDYGVDAERRWPLILFLHGAGERGDDIDIVKRNGIPKVVDAALRAGEDFPFIAISPQCPCYSAWVEQEETVLGLLDEVVVHYAVDTQRVYLTGLSMGGFGTYYIALNHPERFAAIVPICGGLTWWTGFRERADALKNMPAWVFHGAKDETVPLAASQEAVDALRAAGNEAVRLTVYPDAGHDSWTETYNNPELYAWLLSHSR